MKTVFFASSGRQVAPPTERLRLGQPEVGLLELDGAPLDGQLGDLAGKVLGDALLDLEPREVGTNGVALQVDRPTEAAGRDVVPHSRVQLGEPVRELGPVDDLVGDASRAAPGPAAARPRAMST